MVDIKQWMNQFIEKLESAFSDRIVFIGLQGSYARGEANETSDIDTVVIFDELHADDIVLYDSILNTLPERELTCGFISGMDELINWEPSDLFQFYYDTIPIKGSIDELLKLLDAEAINRAVKIGACNIYHACVHNMVHEKNMEMLSGLYKSAFFVVQAVHFRNTGVYVKKKSELIHQVKEPEQEIIKISEILKSDSINQKDFIPFSEKLFTWSQSLINNKICG